MTAEPTLLSRQCPYNGLSYKPLVTETTKEWAIIQGHPLLLIIGDSTHQNTAKMLPYKAAILKHTVILCPTYFKRSSASFSVEEGAHIFFLEQMASPTISRGYAVRSKNFAPEKLP